MLVPLTKGGDIALDKDSPALSPCSCLGIDGCLSWWATTHSGIEAMHTASWRLSPSNIVPLCPDSACMRLDEGSGLKRIARIDHYRVNYNDVPFSTQLDLSFTYFHTRIRLSSHRQCQSSYVRPLHRSHSHSPPPPLRPNMAHHRQRPQLRERATRRTRSSSYLKRIRACLEPIHSRRNGVKGC